jgi:heptosyltransferase III
MNFKLVRWVDIYLGIPFTFLLFLVKGSSLKKQRIESAQAIRKILLVKFWGVGNVLMLLPSVAALKNAYPGAKIDFFTLDTNSGVSRAAGIFDNIYTLDIRGLARLSASLKNNIPVLINSGYDLVIDFEQFARFSALLCAFIGNKRTIGFWTKGQHRHFLYTDPVVYNNNVHITQSFYNLVKAAGVKDGLLPEPAAFLSCKSKMPEVEKMLDSAGIKPDDILVVLHPGTSENFSLRRWPPEYFARLADKLIDSFSAKIVFTGVPREAALVKKILDNMKNKQQALDLSGKLDFSQLVCLIKSSSLVISADTAPVHLASCLSVPVAGLYGPNTPFLYGPWGRQKHIWFYKGLACSPCITNYNAKINKCRHPQGAGACMREIRVEEVFSGIKKNFFNAERVLRV